MLGYKEYTWDTIRDKFITLYPEFSSIIDKLSPNDNYKLYAATYPYGALILDQGRFQLINEQGELVPLSDNSIDKSIQQSLGYTGTMPMGLVTENSIETFFYGLDGRTIPSSFYTPGDMISLWRVLEGECSYQEGSLWSISAGSRTICMLPKLSDKTQYQRLKRKFQLKQDIPRTLNEHWSLFKSISAHENFPQQWKTEII